MLWQPHLQRRRAKSTKRVFMFAEIALEGENAYCHNLL
jgi:hypothetical protein